MLTEVVFFTEVDVQLQGGHRLLKLGRMTLNQTSEIHGLLMTVLLPVPEMAVPLSGLHVPADIM